MSRAGGGINTGLISSVRSGNGGGGGSGRLFGAGPSIAKDDVKSGLDKIFGKISLGEPMSRNQGMSKLMGAAPVLGDDSNGDKSGLDKIFGKISLGEPMSRNQGMSKLMGAAPVLGDDDFEDKKKVFGQLPEMAPIKAQERMISGAVNVPIEERQKLMDFIAEIVGGNAVSNIQVQVPQAVRQGPQQLYGPAQPGPQQLYGPAQPGPPSQQVDTLLQRIKLLGQPTTLVEKFSTSDKKLYTIYALVIIVVLVICIKMNL